MGRAWTQLVVVKPLAKVGRRSEHNLAGMQQPWRKHVLGGLFVMPGVRSWIRHLLNPRESEADGYWDQNDQQVLVPAANFLKAIFNGM